MMELGGAGVGAKEVMSTVGLFERGSFSVRTPIGYLSG